MINAIALEWYLSRDSPDPTDVFHCCKLIEEIVPVLYPAMNQAIEQPTDQPKTDLPSLKTWAVPLTDEIENYPNYWTLKGWRCFVAR